MARKKQQPHGKKIEISLTTIWKTVVGVVTGITAIFVLVITINAIIEPYYELKDTVGDMVELLEEQAQQLQESDADIDKIREDIAAITKVLHLVLESAAGSKIDKDEILSALTDFEDTVIYDVEDDEETKQTTDAQQAIQDITQSTLEALEALK